MTRVDFVPQRNLVGDYDDETHCLEQALVLKDAISDLPPVSRVSLSLGCS